MNNSNTSFSANGQLPNLNLAEINGLMRQFAQLMEGDFMRSIQQLSQLQNMFPNMNSTPVIPMNSPHPPRVDVAQINAMLSRLQSLVNNDLMRIMFNLQTPNANNAYVGKSPSITPMNRNITLPIQIWENDQYMYVLAGIPGLKDREAINIQFVSDTKIMLRVKMPQTYRPERKSRLVHSEFVRGTIEREIELSQPVSTKSYSSSYVDGVYTLTLHKQTDDMEIPIMEE